MSPQATRAGNKPTTTDTQKAPSIQCYLYTLVRGRTINANLFNTPREEFHQWNSWILIWKRTGDLTTWCFKLYSAVVFRRSTCKLLRNCVKAWTVSFLLCFLCIYIISFLIIAARIYTPFHEDKGGAGTKAWNAVVNALIIISLVLALTVVLVLLYKYRCYKVSIGSIPQLLTLHFSGFWAHF